MSFRKERASTACAIRTADVRGRYADSPRIRNFDDRAKLTAAETREKERLFRDFATSERSELDWHGGVE